MTKEEKHLYYDFLNKLPIQVKRQKSIDQYIVDFYIPCAKVVIEIDGAQHYEPQNRSADIERDSKLKKLGITVLRYTNIDINKNFDGVTIDILNKIGLTFEDLKIDHGTSIKTENN